MIERAKIKENLEGYKIGFFFILLFFVENDAPQMSIFLIICIYMLLYIFLSSQQDFTKPILFSITAVSLFFLLSYNSDYEYAVFKFNSALYPVSVHDYLTTYLSAGFAYYASKKNAQLFLSTMQIFAGISTIWIGFQVFDWFFNEKFPYSYNSNWSATLIISFLLITVQTLMKLGFHIFTSRKHFISKKTILWVLVITLLIACIINVYLLLETGSRSANLAFLFGLSGILLFKFNTELTTFLNTTKNRVATILVATTVLLLLSPFLSSTNFARKITNIFDNANTLRGYIYLCYLKVFRDNIFFGKGMGASAQFCEQHLAETANYAYRPGYVNHAHNFILQIAANHGALVLLVAVSLIAFYTFWFLKFWQRFKVDRSKDRETTSVLYLTTFALGFASLFQSSIYHVPFLQIWLGLLIGCTIAVTSIKPP